MAGESGRATTWMDLLKASMWPLLVLLIGTMYYRPVYSILETIAKRSSDIQTVKIGQLELNIKVSDLPAPSREIVSVLPALNEDMIILLVSGSENGGVCFPGDMKNDKRYIAYSELAKLGQFDMKIASSPPDFCENSHDLNLTKQGLVTKKFIIEMISLQLSRSKISST